MECAESTGKLSGARISEGKKTIIEASSGNTGIAIAMIAAVKGYNIEILMPESVSVERRKIISAYGAKLNPHARCKGYRWRDRTKTKDAQGSSRKIR